MNTRFQILVFLLWCRVVPRGIVSVEVGIMNVGDKVMWYSALNGDIPAVVTGKLGNSLEIKVMTRRGPYRKGDLIRTSVFFCVLR